MADKLLDRGRLYRARRCPVPLYLSFASSTDGQVGPLPCLTRSSRGVPAGGSAGQRLFGACGVRAKHGPQNQAKNECPKIREGLGKRSPGQAVHKHRQETTNVPNSLGVFRDSGAGIGGRDPVSTAPLLSAAAVFCTRQGRPAMAGRP
jgi:hypothetical protein